MKAGAFYTVFKTLRALETRRITDTRRDNLKAKRTEKLEINRQIPSTTFRRVGRAPPEYTEEEKRIASISDPSISSAGKELFIASYEANCQSLANDFCGIVLDTVFSQDPSIDWVTGRAENPVIQWDQSYFLSLCFWLMSRSLVAEIKLGPRRIGARTDGGLFISLPQQGQFIAWDRSYYEIALEVIPLQTLLIVGKTLGQGEM
jgi:hypothetical protein